MVRQYTQFIALMENWGDFEDNLSTALTSTGALQEQADIYAESWEAARKRVKAASEDIYSSLINPDFYIGVDDVLTPILERIATVIDTMGGMKGILITLSALITKVYGNQIAQSIRDMATNLGFMVGYEQRRAIILQNNAAQLAKMLTYETAENELDKDKIKAAQNFIVLQGKVASQINQYTPAQQELIKLDLQHIENLQKLIDKMQESANVNANAASDYRRDIEKNIDTITNWKDRINDVINILNNNNKLKGNALLSNVKNMLIGIVNGSGEAETKVNELLSLFETASSDVGIFDLLEARLRSLPGAVDNSGKHIKVNMDYVDNDMRELVKSLQTVGNVSEMSEAQLKKLFESIAGKKNEVKATIMMFEALKQILTELGRQGKTDRQGNTGRRFEQYKNFLEKYAEAVQSITNATAGTKAGLKQFNQDIGEMDEKLKDGTYRVVDFADKIVMVGNALSRFGMVVSSIRSIGRVFSDEDMSNADRLVTILTSLGMLLPTIARTLNALGISMRATVTIEKGTVAIIEKNIVATIAKNAAKKKEAAGEVVSAQAMAASTAAMLAQVAIIGSVIIAITTVTALIWLLVKAYNADADAAKEAGKQVKILTKRFDECKNAAQELKTEISNYDEGVKALEKLDNQTEEFKTTLEETNKKAKELIETYGLWTEYTTKNGLITFNEGALDNLQKRLDTTAIEAESSLFAGKIYSNQADIQNQITNAVRDLGRMVKYNAEPEGELYRVLLRDELESAIDLWNSKANTPITDEELTEAFIDLIPGLQLSVEELDNFTNTLDSLSESMENATQANEYYAEGIFKNAIELNSQEAIREITKDNEQLYNTLLSALTERVSGLAEKEGQLKEEALANVSVNKNDYNSNAKISEILGTSITNNEELAQEYAKRFLGLDPNSLTYKGTITGKSNFIDTEGNRVFEESLSNEFMRKQLAIQAEQEKILASIESSTEDFNIETYLQSFQKLMDGLQVFSERFGNTDFASAVIDSLASGNYGKIDFSGLSAELPPEDFSKIIAMKPEELMKALGLDEATLQNLGIENAKTWLESFLTELEITYDPAEFQKMMFDAGTTGEESARTLIEGIQSGDIDYKNLEENEDFKNLLKQLDKLKDKYPEIEAYQIELSKAWEVGTQKYIEALEEIQDKLANLRVEEKKQSAHEATLEIAKTLSAISEEGKSEIIIDGNAEKFEQLMESILDANYAIDIEIHTQAEQEFNSIINAMNDIEAKASMIGEGFVVAASDIRELNNTFPGIIQGLENIGNGSVRINQQVAKSAINAAKAEVAADASATTNRLESQALLLRAKQDIYQQMANAARILAGLEVDSDMSASEARAEISAKLAELDQKNSQIAATTEMEHAKEVADNSQENAGIMATNWNRGFASSTLDSARFARAAIVNMKAIVDTDEGRVTEGNFSVNYHGATGVSEEAALVEEVERLLSDDVNKDNQDEWGKVYERLQNLADSTGAMANDIEGMMAQIGTEVTDLSHIFDNISSGKGPKGDSGKKSSSKKGSNASEKDNTGKILEPEEAKDLKDIEERYHEITREIQRQADLLDDINNNIERTYGVNKIRAYKKEQEALNKQLENQNKKLEEAENYLITDKASVSKLFPQAEFNDKGEITNYTNLLQNTLEIYNEFIDKYNQYRATYSTWTKDQQEAAEKELDSWEKQKEAAEEAYQERLETLHKYEDTLDVIQETRDEIEQLQRDIDDNRLNQIEYRLEIVFEVKNMEDLVREFSKKIAESFGDAITHGLKAAEISAENARAEAALYPEYTQQYNDLVNEYEHTDDQADRDRIIHDIEELQSKVISSGEALLEWIETLDDLLPDAIDDARTRFEHFTNWLDHNTTVLDTIKELYALQGVTYKTQQGYERLMRTSAEKMEALTNKAALNRSWYERASEQVEIARAQLESLGGNEEDVRWDIYKANYDALLAEQQKAQEAMLSSAKDALETAREMATLSLEKTMYDLNQQLSKGLGLDLLQDKYDHYIETEERYFDKVNEAYHVASWYNKLQADIDKTSDKTIKDSLKKLQKEIDIRREGNKLSQYDLDILEAKYKVLQAQIALEDAQRIKNNMNLVRDSQGNWNYQFTADQDDIANAEQDLLDADIERYNIAKQQYKDMTSEIIDLTQQCSQEVQEIWQQMIDGTLTEEEGYARIEEKRKYYTEKIKYLEEEKNIAIKDMNEAGNEALFDMAILYGDKISDLTGLSSEEIQGIIGDSGKNIKQLIFADSEEIAEIVGNNTDVINLFKNIFAEDLEEMTISSEDFEQALDDALDECENNWQDYGNNIEDVASSTGTSLEELDDQVNNVADSTEWAYETGLDAARAAAEGYAELAEEILQVIYNLEDLAAAQADYVSSKADLDNDDWKKPFDASLDYSAVMASMVANGYKVNSAEFQEMQRQREEKIKWLASQGKTEDYWKTSGQATINRFQNYESSELRDEWFNSASKIYDNWEELMKKQILGLDTGGYTGVFNNDNGRLAFLHEKELVLNQEDTKNILSAVSAVRDIGPELLANIEKIIDGNAIAAMSLLTERISNSSPINIPSTNIEQRVSIEHVEFPNVTSRDEIIQAFEGLTNDAAQWVQRRKS